VGVKRTFINNAGSPYTDCQDLTTFSSPLYDFIINSSFYSTYTQQDCFNLCIQQMIIVECNCSYSGFDIPPPYTSSFNISAKPRPCLTIADYNCYTKQFSLFNPVTCAAKSCPLECNSINYDLSVSSLLLASIDDFADYYSTYENEFDKYGYYPQYGSLPLQKYENWRTSLFTVYVYYTRIEYTLIEVTPSMTFTDLLANIGGSMSLIVSVSAFTFFELIELILLLVQTLLSYAISTKKNSNSFQVRIAKRGEVGPDFDTGHQDVGQKLKLALKYSYSKV